MFRVVEIISEKDDPKIERLPVKLVLETTEGSNRGHRFSATFSPTTGAIREGADVFIEPEYRDELKRVVKEALLEAGMLKHVSANFTGSVENVATVDSPASQVRPKLKVPPFPDGEVTDPLGPMPGRPVVVTPDPAVIKFRADDPSIKTASPAKEDGDEARKRMLGSVTATSEVKANLTVERLEGKVAKLPRWAKLAFAARCVRRVQPLLGAGPADVEGEPVARAIALAEGAATRAGVGIDPDELAGARDAADQRALVLASESRDDARMRAVVAEAASVAADAAYGSIVHSEGKDVVEAAQHTQEASELAGVGELAATAVLRDLDLLLEAARLQSWTDDTPVPPESLGPLWPAGPPPGWPQAAETEREITGSRGSAGISSGDRSKSLVLKPLTVYLDPGDAPQELITEFYLALSAVYRSFGGDGLKIVKEELGTMVAEEVEA
jgi:hypothetical protein